MPELIRPGWHVLGASVLRSRLCPPLCHCPLAFFTLSNKGNSFFMLQGPLQILQAVLLTGFPCLGKGSCAPHRNI